uniref:F-box only protein 16-like isoform X2 n=1 Tax=Myxine glutinosa TaxID=7769 RepID=UPI00358E5699
MIEGTGSDVLRSKVKVRSKGEVKRADQWKIMAAAKPMNGVELQTTSRTWTPMNQHRSHGQSPRRQTVSNVFLERKELLLKWFDCWTETQRQDVLLELLSRSSERTWRRCEAVLRSHLPERCLDFTCCLPRLLSLYIMSFLDPRSLCRAAQVSWHWRELVELDQLWLPKCVRFGWMLPFSPSPFECGVWKQHYVHTVTQLKCTRPTTPMSDGVGLQCALSHRMKDKSARCSSAKVRTIQPPWRDSDKYPMDILRYNYLDNVDITGPPKDLHWQHGPVSVILDPKQSLHLKKTTVRILATQPLHKAGTPIIGRPGAVRIGDVRPSWAGQHGQAWNEEAAAAAMAHIDNNAGIHPGPIQKVAATRKSQCVGDDDDLSTRTKRKLTHG